MGHEKRWSPPTGRPTKLTSEVAEAVFAAITRGSEIETAVRAAGISRQLLHNWKQYAVAGKEPYQTFLDICEEKRAQRIIELREVVAAGDLGWQGSARLLEALDRDFIRTEKREVAQSTGQGAPFVIQLMASDRPAGQTLPPAETPELP